MLAFLRLQSSLRALACLALWFRLTFFFWPILQGTNMPKTCFPAFRKQAGPWCIPGSPWLHLMRMGLSNSSSLQECRRMLTSNTSEGYSYFGYYLSLIITASPILIQNKRNQLITTKVLWELRCSSATLPAWMHYYSCAVNTGIWWQLKESQTYLSKGIPGSINRVKSLKTIAYKLIDIQW